MPATMSRPLLAAPLLLPNVRAARPSIRETAACHADNPSSASVASAPAMTVSFRPGAAVASVLGEEAGDGDGLRWPVADAVARRRQRALGEVDAAGGEAEQPQIRRGAGQRRVGVLRSAPPIQGVASASAATASPSRSPMRPNSGRLEARTSSTVCCSSRDVALDHLAAFQRQLARDEVDGLDAVGALVDRQDARVAIDAAPRRSPR